VRVSVSVLKWVRVRVSELGWDWTMPRVLNSGAEGMIVLVELAWLRSISGADAPPPSPFRTRKTSDNSIRRRDTQAMITRIEKVGMGFALSRVKRRIRHVAAK